MKSTKTETGVRWWSLKTIEVEVLSDSGREGSGDRPNKVVGGTVQGRKVGGVAQGRKVGVVTQGRKVGVVTQERKVGVVKRSV